jgi:hypothetical protein
MKKNLCSVALLMLATLPSLMHAQLVKKTEVESKFLGRGVERPAASNGFVRCLTTEYENYLQAKDPSRMTTEQFEAWLAPLVKRQMENKSQVGNVITIPVVVHVIHSGQNIGVAPNITDAQVQSQITVMTQDYRKMMSTPGYNTNPVGADVEIEFVLAKVDPNGNPTNGIDRVNLCDFSWSTTDIDAVVKPTTIWNPNDYMNMWSVNFSDSTLLGYAQFPSGSTLGGLQANGGSANTDGVVANFSTFGSSDFNDGTFFLGAPYDKGRTMTHEVGHFLGLRHIWGDNTSCVVNAADSQKDYCPDTPAATGANSGCPTVDSCPADPGNDMVQNYMDYTNDACMNIFTQNQKTRIRTVLNNSPRRSTLKTSTKDQAIPLFPNDAEIKVENMCADALKCGSDKLKLAIINRGTSPLTSATISYSINGAAAQSYSWSGNLSQDKWGYISVPVSSTVTNGPVTVNIVSVNGTTDQRATNNTATGTYTQSTSGNPDYFNTTTVNFKLQRDQYGTETNWILKNSAGQIVKAGGPYNDTANPGLISQTWTLPLDCYEFKLFDAYGDGMSELATSYVELKTSDNQTIFYATGDSFTFDTGKNFTTQFLATRENNLANEVQVYPNPVSDELNITKVSNKATFELHNAVGQLVNKGKVVENKVQVSHLEKGVYVISIQDGNMSKKVKFIKK